MTVPHEVAHIVRQWIEKAEDDFKAASYLLNLREDCPVSTVAFHAQQCSEKYIKAALTYYLIPFQKTHDLSNLFLKIPNPADISLKILFPAV